MCLTLFIVFLILFTSYLYFIFAFPYFYCSYVNTCFLLFIPLFQKLYMCGIVLSMNLNLKMTVERSKHCSYFLSLVFITKSVIIPVISKSLHLISFLHNYNKGDASNYYFIEVSSIHKNLVSNKLIRVILAP